MLILLKKLNQIVVLVAEECITFNRVLIKHTFSNIHKIITFKARLEKALRIQDNNN